jgi:hypothetical protein
MRCHSHSSGTSESFVVLKLLSPVDGAQQPPFCFAMIDEEGETAAVSVYCLAPGVASQWTAQDSFVVLDPVVKQVDFSYKQTVRTKPMCFVVAF